MWARPNSWRHLRNSHHLRQCGWLGTPLPHARQELRLTDIGPLRWHALRGAAKMELFDYIEVFYNQRRRHSTIGQANFEKASTTSSSVDQPSTESG